MRRHARSVLAASLAAGLLAAAVPTTASAAFTAAEQKCRQTVAKSGSKLTKTVFKVLNTCHKNRDKDGALSGTNCNSIVGIDASSKIPASIAKFESGVTGKCVGFTPSDVLYDDCPAPCDASVPNINNFGDVVDCEVCLTLDSTQDYAATANGSPASPAANDAEASCHAAVTKNGTKLYNAVLKLVAKCQATSEKGGSEEVSSCVQGASFTTMTQADFDKAHAAILGACGEVDYPSATLDACGMANTAFEHATCVTEEARSSAQQLATWYFDLSVDGPTTTTTEEPATTTTTTTTTEEPTTTTTLSNTQDPQCPDLGELLLFAHASDIPCTNDSECAAPRTCDESIGFCVTVADLDSGWTGLAHDSDINDGVRTRAFLFCPGTGGPTCGTCNVEGLDPSPGNCRCTNGGLNPAGFRTICDEPFQADADDCGGQICDCYFGAPFPLNSAGTHVCVVNRFTEDVTGTANVDLGAGVITAKLRTRVSLGIVGEQPCPVCGGKCSDDQSACVFDEDCGGGGATCVQDIAGDGNRDGICIGGNVNGDTCDVTATNASFPAKIGGARPGGGGYSIDCQPDVGANVTGEGLAINLVQTTGTSTLPSQVDCNGAAAGTDLCPCLMCSKDTTQTCMTNGDCVSQGGQCNGVSSPARISCSTNSDCASVTTGTCTAFNGMRCSQDFGKTCMSNADCQNRDIGPCNISTCTAIGAGTTPKPNGCSGLTCNDIGGGEGECATGPDDKYCDGLVRIDGTGMKTCANNSDCSGIGACTYVKRRECFLNPIVGQGDPDPDFPVATSTFCLAPTGATSVNQVAGLPGPARVLTQAEGTTFCASDRNVVYQPGIGGCP